MFSLLFPEVLKKKCFPNIVACHKVFPPLPVASAVLGWESRIHWQAVQQTPLLAPAAPAPAPVRRDMASA